MLSLKFDFYPMTPEMIEEFAVKRKIVLLMDLRKFILKGPCTFDFVRKDGRKDGEIVRGCYGVNEFNNNVTFMTAWNDELATNYWYSDLEPQYEDTLKRLLLLRPT